MEVRVRDLEFERDGRFFLRVPDLYLPRGTVTALLGPNGAGKTTLLRLLCGLEEPARGRVTLGGRPREEVEMGRVAYAFQEAIFLSGSVRRNLELALELRGIPAAERGERIEAATEATGVRALLEVDAARLSGGQAQRANLARALALRSPLTILDEPLAKLDGVSRLHLLDALPDLLRRFTTTSILVTHNREEAFALADHLLVLVDGGVRAYGETATLLKQPPDAEVAGILGFVVLRSQGRQLAVRPEELRAGEGPLSFDLVVGRVLDLGRERRVVGRIETTRVGLSLPAHVKDLRTGDVLRVTADVAIPLPH